MSPTSCGRANYCAGCGSVKRDRIALTDALRRRHCGPPLGGAAVHRSGPNRDPYKSRCNPSIYSLGDEPVVSVTRMGRRARSGSEEPDMRKLGHVARDVAGVLVVVLMLLPSGGRIAQGADTPCDPAAPPRAGITYLCQGWSADKAEWWYHVSQGTAIMPYAWFMALEQASGTAPFTAPDHLARLGFLPDPPSKDNPDGLPVGFAARELDFPSTVPFKLYKGKWIGFACSACHTGQVRYNGAEIRIDGGPSHIDLEAFGSDL